MDWQISPLSKQSTVSGEAFSPGERITCYLIRNQEGQWERIDLHSSEEDALPEGATILGRWSRLVKENDNEEERLKKAQTLQSTEELFLSLFELNENEPLGEEALEDQQVLKQILALMLERKRILRPQTSRKSSIQNYLHIKLKKVFEVPQEELTPEMIQRVHEQLELLVI